MAATMPHHPGMTRKPRGLTPAPASTGPVERPPRNRGRPRRAQADAARRSILDAALRVFGEHGFESASMEGIARDAGVAKLTLYRHFETKNRLFEEVVRRAQLSVRERLGTMVDRGLPLDEVLREIITRLYDGYTHPEYLAVLRMVIAEAGRFPRLGRAMLDDSREVSEPLVHYLQQLKDNGQIDVESPLDAVTQICGLAMGAGRYVLTTPSRRPSRRRHAIESLVTLFTRAWRVQAKTGK